jgi:hypothetical protein
MRRLISSSIVSFKGKEVMCPRSRVKRVAGGNELGMRGSRAAEASGARNSPHRLGGGLQQGIHGASIARRFTRARKFLRQLPHARNSYRAQPRQRGVHEGAFL